MICEDLVLDSNLGFYSILTIPEPRLGRKVPERQKIE